MSTPPSTEGGDFVQNDRTEIPVLGFGTYQIRGWECYNAVREALELGYRHVDTAMAYENESAVGRAIEQSSVDRDDVFLTTKVKGYPELLKYDRLLEATQGCLERLGTDYVDLLLVHWWNPGSDMEATFDALNRLADEGAVNRIGVSNFSVEQLREAIRVSDTPIATNQIEYHPYWWDGDLLAFCQEHDVTLTAYSPLAEGKLVDDERLQVIGDRYGKSPAQVSLRWLIQQENVVTIPKSVTPRHMQANLDVFDFELTDREMRRVSELEPPFWYRHNREGGYVHRARGIVGPLLPGALYDRIV